MVTYTTCSRIPIFFFSYVSIHIVFAYQEEFEDTKGVIRIRISRKNRQHKIDHLLSMNFNKGSMTTGDISRAKTGSFFIIRVHHWGSRWSICFIFCLYVGFFCRPLIAFLFLCRFSCGNRIVWFLVTSFVIFKLYFLSTLNYPVV